MLPLLGALPLCGGLRKGSRTADLPAKPEAPEILKSFDARDWARAFVAYQRENPSIATDEETMTAWFANALMRGYDERRRQTVLGPAGESPSAYFVERWSGKPGAWVCTRTWYGINEDGHSTGTIHEESEPWPLQHLPLCVLDGGDVSMVGHDVLEAEYTYWDGRQPAARA